MLVKIGIAGMNITPFSPDTRPHGSESTNEEKKKELRRVYRKLKGVRSQISMKMKELKKEVEQTPFSYDDDIGAIPETDLFSEEYVEEEKSGKNDEQNMKDQPIATQSELKMLVDHKARLRKRFKKLLDEVQTKRRT